ncbi:hypothetical protein Baya_2788 [Bagarius yarrelli]|uniref:Uncharacterized protein n=1 Tax=Bagarius yarrelli TaxID=175774 RepID=A0A556TQJ2_BAGYA|nr:hypothetical protein Baya_2788 [Bagarius yarrelli]
MAALSVMDVLSAGWRMKDGAEPAGNMGKMLRSFNPTLLHHNYTSNRSSCFSEAPTVLSVGPDYHPFMAPFIIMCVEKEGGVWRTISVPAPGPEKIKTSCPPAALPFGLCGSQVAFQPVYEPQCPAALHFHTLHSSLERHVLSRKLQLQNGSSSF